MGIAEMLIGALAKVATGGLKNHHDDPQTDLTEAQKIQQEQKALLESPDSPLPHEVGIDGKQVPIADALREHPEALANAMKGSDQAMETIEKWNALQNTLDSLPPTEPSGVAQNAQAPEQPSGKIGIHFGF